MAGIKLWPPTSSLASSPCSVNSRIASSTECAGKYPKLAGNIFASYLLRGSTNRLDDIDVVGAVAQIAFQRVTDLFFGRIRSRFQQVHCGHNHARRAVAAL